MNTAIQDAYDLGWRLTWVLRGWADSALLDTYEDVRRPVGMHNVQRAGQPDGARRDAEDGLQWDLNGRVPHRWITTQEGLVSTLDLVSDGLTLFAGPHEPRWRHTEELTTRAPITTHILDPVDAEALRIPPLGAMLVGPDSRPLTVLARLQRPGCTAADTTLAVATRPGNTPRPVADTGDRPFLPS